MLPPARFDAVRRSIGRKKQNSIASGAGRLPRLWEKRAATGALLLISWVLFARLLGDSGLSCRWWCFRRKVCADHSQRIFFGKGAFLELNEVPATAEPELFAHQRNQSLP